MTNPEKVQQVKSWVQRNIVLVNGRYYLAKWSIQNSQWYGPLHPTTRKITGCSQWFARSKAGIPGAGGHSWASLKIARTWVSRQYDLGMLDFI